MCNCYHQTIGRLSMQVSQYFSWSDAAIQSLLGYLPSLYPKADLWIDKTLQHIESRRSSCFIGHSRGEILGVWIESDKGLRSRKISTIFIDERARGRGLGSSLYDAAYCAWRRQGLDHVYVTVPHCRLPKMQRFLSSRDFYESAYLPSRYGEGRHESVFAKALR